MAKKYTKLLGFDFGLRRIGVATGQTITHTASPLCILAANAGIPKWPEVASLIQTWRPEALIVGLPLNMDDSEQYITNAAKNFGELLKIHYALPVFMMDERLSTRAAKEQLFEEGGYRALRNTKRVDAIAAKLILETWMREYESANITALPDQHD